VSVPVPVIVVTGPVGVGKTTVAVAISELLDGVGMAHAMVDVDQLRWCYPAPADDPFHMMLGLRNLAAVWANYRAEGAQCLILADVVERRADVTRYREAIPGAAILVVRLQASLSTIEGRLAGREAGAGLDWHRRRAAELIALMERNRAEDILIDTEEKSAVAIAQETIARAQWLRPSERPDIGNPSR
jgi:predicted kinase